MAINELTNNASQRHSDIQQLKQSARGMTGIMEVLGCGVLGGHVWRLLRLLGTLTALCFAVVYLSILLSNIQNGKTRALCSAIFLYSLK